MCTGDEMIIIQLPNYPITQYLNIPFALRFYGE